MKRFVLACLQLFSAATGGQQATTSKESDAKALSDCWQLPALQKQLDWDVQWRKD